jgi:signal transduction histidine kinase
VNVQIEAARAVHSLDAGRSRDALDKAQSLTQEGLKEIRRSVAALRASPLENKSLAAAIQQIVDDSRASGLSVEMETVGATRELSAAAELTLYRVAQEGLTNVRKHAAAAQAKLKLEFTDGKKVQLIVSDDGAGARNLEQSRGFGLLGLRERAQLLGGHVRTRTAPDAGFTLEVEVPG